MSARSKYHWTVTLQASDGEIIQQPVAAFWDPEKEGTSDAIGAAGKAEAWAQFGGKREFSVIAVAQNEDVKAAA